MTSPPEEVCAACGGELGEWVIPVRKRGAPKGRILLCSNECWDLLAREEAP
jgi:hypothetical protein